jgi:hypothetical protein
MTRDGVPTDKQGDGHERHLRAFDFDHRRDPEIRDLPGQRQGLGQTGKRRARKYPALPGANMPLGSLSLRALIVSQEDLAAKNLLYGNIEPMIRNFKGNTLGFYPEDFNDGEFKESIDRILTDAMLHGCFY